MRTEDGYIVRECLNGDKSAFALLVDKYKEAVFAILLSDFIGNSCKIWCLRLFIIANATPIYLIPTFSHLHKIYNTTLEK